MICITLRISVHYPLWIRRSHIVLSNCLNSQEIFIHNQFEFIFQIFKIMIFFFLKNHASNMKMWLVNLLLYLTSSFIILFSNFVNKFKFFLSYFENNITIVALHNHVFIACIINDSPYNNKTSDYWIWLVHNCIGLPHSAIWNFMEHHQH